MSIYGGIGMNEFFSADFTGEPFYSFSKIHIATLAILILINLILFVLLKKIKSDRLTNFFRYFLGMVLIISEVSYVLWSILSGDWSVEYSLPLHLCDVSAILCGIMLLIRSKAIYEVTYFWGLAASLQAIITPDLYPYNYPHFMYFQFFISHSSVVTAVLFMTLILKYRPVLKSIAKTFAVTNIYMAIISVVNHCFDSNYLFLSYKPNGASIFDYLGPWPWYILSLEAVGLLLMIFCYMPFGISDLHQKHKMTDKYKNNKIGNNKYRHNKFGHTGAHGLNM